MKDDKDKDGIAGLMLLWMLIDLLQNHTIEAKGVHFVSPLFELVFDCV